MSEVTDAVVDAIFLTTIITSMFWLLVWSITTIGRLKRENNE